MRLISHAPSRGRLMPPPQIGASSSYPTRDAPPGGLMSAGVALGALGTSILPYRGTISATIAATRSAAGGAAASALRNSSTSLSSRIRMARDWTELFILDGGAPADAVAEEAQPE